MIFRLWLQSSRGSRTNYRIHARDYPHAQAKAREHVEDLNSIPGERTILLGIEEEEEKNVEK